MMQKFNLDNVPITVIVGAYGSGKSEVSVNLALAKAASGKVYLADLDIINPFYRSADTAELLKARNVKLISSIYAGTNVDVPAVPGEINRLFADQEATAVLDIGGEDLGARIVGSIKPKLEAVQHQILMVVNPFRPFTDTAKKIEEMVVSLEDACKLKIEGLIYNPNLLEYTTSDLVEEGWEVISAASKLVDIPIRLITVMNEYMEPAWDFTKAELPVLRMERTIYYPSDDRV